MSPIGYGSVWATTSSEEGTRLADGPLFDREDSENEQEEGSPWVRASCWQPSSLWPV